MLDRIILALVLICLPLPVVGLLLPEPPDPPPVTVPVLGFVLHNNQHLGCKNLHFKENTLTFLYVLFSHSIAII